MVVIIIIIIANKCATCPSDIDDSGVRRRLAAVCKQAITYSGLPKSHTFVTIALESLLMKLIFRLNGSWIVTDLPQ